jgi:hypothetical protein
VIASACPTAQRSSTVVDIETIVTRRRRESNIKPGRGVSASYNSSPELDSAVTPVEIIEELITIAELNMMSGCLAVTGTAHDDEPSGAAGGTSALDTSSPGTSAALPGASARRENFHAPCTLRPCPEPCAAIVDQDLVVTVRVTVTGTWARPPKHPRNNPASQCAHTRRAITHHRSPLCAQLASCSPVTGRSTTCPWYPHWT